MTGEKWFRQDRRWQRSYPIHWKGWVAGLVFIAAFFGLVAFFISLEPFTPLNYWVLGLWWASVLALMFGFNFFARDKVDRPWRERMTKGDR